MNTDGCDDDLTPVLDNHAIFSTCFQTSTSRILLQTAASILVGKCLEPSSKLTKSIQLQLTSSVTVAFDFLDLITVSNTLPAFFATQNRAGFTHVFGSQLGRHSLQSALFLQSIMPALTFHSSFTWETVISAILKILWVKDTAPANGQTD